MESIIIGDPPQPLTVCDTAVANPQPVAFCDAVIGNSNPLAFVDASVGNFQQTTSCDAAIGNSQPTSFCSASVGNSQPVAFCDVAIGNSQPTSFCDVAIGNSQPSTFCSASAGNSQPMTFCDVAIGNSQPSTFCSTSAGNSQPMSFCDVAIGNSQPMLFCDARIGNSQQHLSFVNASVGNSQPMSFCDATTGNSQPSTPLKASIGNTHQTSFCDVAVGNSQPSTFCNASTGNSQPSLVSDIYENENNRKVDIHEYSCSQVNQGQEITDTDVATQSTGADFSQLFNSEHQNADEENYLVEDNNTDDLGSERSHDQRLSQPDIYTLMDASSDNDEDIHSQHETNTRDGSTITITSVSDPIFIHNSEGEAIKRRRVLGEIQQVPASRNSRNNTPGAPSTRTNFVNRNEDGLRFVPSGCPGLIVNMDIGNSICNSELSSKYNTNKDGDKADGENLLQRTHAAIRVNPQQRLRLGLSKRIPIPPLHTRPRRHSQDENEN